MDLTAWRQVARHSTSTEPTMSTRSSSSAVGSGTARDESGRRPGSPGFTAELERLAAGLRRTHFPPSQSDDAALVQQLETAYEELRVADQEVRTQHELVARLLESHHGVRLQQEQTLAVLPVPVLLTDRYGAVRSLNPPAMALLGQPLRSVLGKPLATLFAGEDRAAVRDLVSLVRRGRPASARLALVGRPVAAPVVVRLAGSGAAGPGGPADAETWWVLDPQRDATTSAMVSTLTSVLRLSATEADDQTFVHDACRACAEALGPGTAVSLSLGRPDEPTTLATSSWLAARLDGAQVTAGEGPTLDAHARDTTVSADDLGTDPRWPRLPAHLPVEAAGAVAAPLRSGSHVVGTLTAYLPRGHHDSTALIELLSASVGATVHLHELDDALAALEEQMHQALQSRATIEQAKGIVMSSLGVGPDEAWHRIVRMSNEQNTKLRVVAERIVDSVGRRL